MSKLHIEDEREKYLTNKDLDKIEGKGTNQSVGCFHDSENEWGITDWVRFQEALKAGYSRYFAAIFTNQHYWSTSGS